MAKKKQIQESKYYDGRRLLSLKDINGEKPEIFMVDGNRTAGKTYFFKKYMLESYLKEGQKAQFCTIHRYKTDLAGVSMSFFSDISDDFPADWKYKEERLFDGSCVMYLLNDNICGFALALNTANKLKEKSGTFVNVKHAFFDEYQSEDNRYLKDEIEKMQSLHTSIARGHGKQTRYVPFFMSSNTVSILNPYYGLLGINKRLRSDTKILRGDGWVFEKTHNESASAAFKESAFNRAFSGTKYNKFASENIYLNDNTSLIEKPKGQGEYILTLIHNGSKYSLIKYDSLWYCQHGCDESYPSRFCVKVNDMDGSMTRIESNKAILKWLRGYFDSGLFRFQDLECKNIVLDILNLQC